MCGTTVVSGVLVIRSGITMRIYLGTERADGSRHPGLGI